jgi:hypothetical protein
MLSLDSQAGLMSPSSESTFLLLLPPINIH